MLSVGAANQGPATSSVEMSIVPLGLKKESLLPKVMFHSAFPKIMVKITIEMDC